MTDIYFRVLEIATLSIAVIPTAYAFTMCIMMSLYYVGHGKFAELVDPFGDGFMESIFTENIINVFFGLVISFIFSFALSFGWPVFALWVVFAMPTTIARFMGKKNRMKSKVVSILSGHVVEKEEKKKPNFKFRAIVVLFTVISLIFVSYIAEPRVEETETGVKIIFEGLKPNRKNDIIKLRKQYSSLAESALGSPPRCVWDIKTDGVVFTTFCGAFYIEESFDNLKDAEDRMKNYMDSDIKDFRAIIAKRDSKPVYGEVK